MENAAGYAAAVVANAIAFVVATCSISGSSLVLFVRDNTTGCISKFGFKTCTNIL
jgi:hypothetical protein